MAVKSRSLTADADVQVGGSGIYGEAVVVRLSGTWAGTVTFQARVRDGVATWVDILANNAETDADAVDTTGNGIFRIVADGLDINVNFDFTSGTLVLDAQEVTV